ncbi:MAG TPA: tRNA (N(6)-L-threonylcarbamoyladenosine(37)-C(2))-methylthiotransferase [Methanocorpusculum sp.]|nr:tRNA (N(6)-L-threonylcarbamoyladenosine(37)-C(2))-methylthiotransferase [Methanocorpusculum sp.]
MDMSGSTPFDRLKNLKLYAETYGCTYNAGDTDKILEIAKANGCRITDTPADADAVLINTCVVIEKTEQHMYERLTLFEKKELFITGCLPGIAEERLRSQFPKAHIIPPEIIHPCWKKAGTMPSARTVVLQIARGCSGHCTYCITRLARGKLASFSAEDIIEQAKICIKAGAAELQVTAQDTASWGLDFTGDEKDRRLPYLLRELSKLDGNFMIRVGMANPDNLLPILDEYLDVLKSPKIFLFLHIPVQSGSDSVLKQMGRRYTAEEYEEIISRARKIYPDIRICTDYIAGFSGETDEDAKASVEQILRTRPGKVNITRFSVRPKTPAAKWKRIPEPIKKERSKALTDAVNTVYDANGDALLGREFDCIVTETDKPGSVTARDRSYQNIVILEELPIGMRLRVRITENRRHYLIGERISS